VVAVVAVLAVLVVVLLARHDRTVSGLLETHATREHEWALERSELLTRAMHPQVVLPPRTMVAQQAEPPEADDFNKIGMILEGDVA
jgi:hypothetical protein